MTRSSTNRSNRLRKNRLRRTNRKSNRKRRSKSTRQRRRRSRKLIGGTDDASHDQMIARQVGKEALEQIRDQTWAWFNQEGNKTATESDEKLKLLEEAIVVYEKILVTPPIAATELGRNPRWLQGLKSDTTGIRQVINEKL